ncbi:MAG TPA: carboxylating nicotinate-nucleotide diphosphorylase [Polyangiales bacterium]|jgi:nicotinate-nucleotide pyrophosphorylase (carboxylating)|nr:carboxylating nicotinate-nucleotide diphosphorylase [Polyangiales bacterium]
MPVPRFAVSAIVRIALEEDLGRGDLTTEACVAADSLGRAVLRARERAVFCGAELVREVYAQVDPAVSVDLKIADGTLVEPGATILQLRGPSRSLLEGERVALNFAQRLSGVATLTRSYVDAIPAGCRTRIVDTRKTTPGLRALERYAVRAGGGHNHREDLSTAVLIKDNHIAAAGGVTQAIERARARAPHTSRIECEVDTLSQLTAALNARADVVLLDNFDDTLVAEAVTMIAGRAIIEVSGSVSRERIATLARAGVDVISVGALTHSARAVDLGLDWDEASA